MGAAQQLRRLRGLAMSGAPLMPGRVGEPHKPRRGLLQRRTTWLQLCLAFLLLRLMRTMWRGSAGASGVPHAHGALLGGGHGSAAAQHASQRQLVELLPIWDSHTWRKGQPTGTYLPPPVVEEGSGDACAQALQLPRVALLFLAQGPLHHEQTWTQWFKSAAGVLPAGTALDSACAAGADLKALQAACAPDPTLDAISQQHLFSVYVHVPPEFEFSRKRNATDFPPGSLWRGRLVKRRVHFNRLDMSIMKATRSLLWEAYRDPLNQRFLLLSENDLPLYDPLTLYTQLMAETKSRVDGCRDDQSYRWMPLMEIPGVLTLKHWRKSSNIFTLVRDHARLVLQDTRVYRKFEQWCFQEWEHEERRMRDCYPDEASAHYLATLLSGVLGLKEELSCVGIGPTHQDWDNGRADFYEYFLRDVANYFFEGLRAKQGCAANTTVLQAAVAPRFVPAADVMGGPARAATCKALASTPALPAPPLDPDTCFLLSRKWPAYLAGSVYRLFTDCSDRLGMLRPDVCRAAPPFQPPKRQPHPISAELPQPEVLPASPSACNQALRLPRVALLFLTQGPLHHEASWRLWFKSAAGVLPASTMLASACGKGADVAALREACAVDEDSDDTISQQHLFSVYIHAGPQFWLEGRPEATEYPRGSLWRGRLVTHRVATTWGDMSIVQATRSLLWEAYRDPLNQRFLLLSESDLPLYDPLTLYTQLMAEENSRVEACRLKDSMMSRWTPRMEIPGVLNLTSWRKSSQWFTLIRDHARLVLQDELVFRKFEAWCFMEWDEDAQDFRDCFADEHYIPTLLGGVHGLREQLQCNTGRLDIPGATAGGAAATDWSLGTASGHPKEYGPAEVRAALFSSLRNYVRPCDHEAAQDAAHATFVELDEALGGESSVATCRELAAHPPAYDPPLSDLCYLTARKFPPTTIVPAYRHFTLSCRLGFQLLSDKVCQNPPRYRRESRPSTAELPPPKVDAASPHACAAALRLPRVALLILTKGELHHEATWRRWFQAAAGVLPAGAACHKKPSSAALKACVAAAAASAQDPIAAQHLFSVYIHAAPTFNLSGTVVEDYPEGSLWRGRLVSRRIRTTWGGMGIVEATRSLLWEAYRDPLNQRFLLLSESDLPLYDPLTLYAQLMAEENSRVEACRLSRSSTHRWVNDLTIPGILRLQNWRKSSQWFTLIRDHVQVVLEDEQIFRKFEAHCWSEVWDEYQQKYLDCYPDEHYIPTLLGGVHNLGHQMLCGGGEVAAVSAVDWREMVDGHPKAYDSRLTTPKLIHELRSFLVPCNASTAQEAAQHQFVSLADLASSRKATCAAAAGRPQYEPLSPLCFLMARKFPPETAAVALSLWTDCSNGLGLLGPACRGGATLPAEAAAAGSGE